MTETLTAREIVSRRVGARQWRVLMAAESRYPHPASWPEMREAVGTDHTPAQVRVVLDALLAKSELKHACADDRHALGNDCLFMITEQGANARLGEQGGQRPLMASRIGLLA